MRDGPDTCDCGWKMPVNMAWVLWERGGDPVSEAKIQVLFNCPTCGERWEIGGKAASPTPMNEYPGVKTLDEARLEWNRLLEADDLGGDTEQRLFAVFPDLRHLVGKLDA